MMQKQAIPTLYELSQSGRSGVTLPTGSFPNVTIPDELVREDNGLPEVAQVDVVRHFLKLSQRNYGVDSGFYPLGSCTMKYNPKICEDIAVWPEFALTHPLQPEHTVQGNLSIMFELQQYLCEIGGFDMTSLQPAAGAQGELTALLMIRAYHRDRGDPTRNQILIPDSAHGTNPASTSMAGFDVLQIPSNSQGTVDMDALRIACNDRLAGIMITNPNTLGLFEDNIAELAKIVHQAGGLVYGDGANMNALTGVVKPARLGIDLMHYNLHKTFSTPHGGGGPGAGPLAASATLAEYLPGPLVVESEGNGFQKFKLSNPRRSIGRMGPFQGNFGMLLRAYSYIRLCGKSGLRKNAMHAVLNANYLRVKLRDVYPIPYDKLSKHEFVCQGEIENTPVRALHICKRLLDFGFHPPTNYFPLIVREALLIEPTETETRETLNQFIDAMIEIKREALENPKVVLTAPHSMPVGRLDETRAARRPILSEVTDQDDN